MEIGDPSASSLYFARPFSRAQGRGKTEMLGRHGRALFQETTSPWPRGGQAMQLKEIHTRRRHPRWKKSPSLNKTAAQRNNATLSLPAPPPGSGFSAATAAAMSAAVRMGLKRTMRSGGATKTPARSSRARSASLDYKYEGGASGAAYRRRVTDLHKRAMYRMRLAERSGGLIPVGRPLLSPLAWYGGHLAASPILTKVLTAGAIVRRKQRAP